MNNDPKMLSAHEIEIEEARQRMGRRNESMKQSLVRMEHSLNELAKHRANLASDVAEPIWGDDAQSMSSAGSVDITSDPHRSPEQVVRTGLYNQYKGPLAHYDDGIKPNWFEETPRGNVSYADKREHSEEVVQAIASLEDNLARISRMKDQLKILKVQHRNALTSLLTEGRDHEMHRNNLIDASTSAAKHLPIAEEGRRIEKKLEQEEEKDMMALTEDMVSKNTKARKPGVFKRMFGKN